MRKYQPIWEVLKLEGTASLAASPEKHRRIVLAVRKEKVYDLGWKYACQEKKKKFKLLNRSDDSLLCFTLKHIPTLTIADL